MIEWRVEVMKWEGDESSDGLGERMMTEGASGRMMWLQVPSALGLGCNYLNSSKVQTIGKVIVVLGWCSRT